MALADVWSPQSQSTNTARLALLIDESIEETLEAIRVRARASNESVVVEAMPPVLEVIGYGTDAVVVRHPALLDHVFKVYTPQSIGCLEDEYEAYRLLAGFPLFASCVGRGPSYLVLSYEAGPTLYDCLVQGLPIDEQVMADVEAARRYARSVGLHPKDVHLKNIVVQGTGAKIFDVSKYLAPGDDDPVWEDLAEGYRRFYPLIRGRRIPRWFIEMVKRRYRAEAKDQFSLEAFGSRMLRFIRALPVAR